MGRGTDQLVETVPIADPSGSSGERLDSAAQEERLTSLFRRWPALRDHELGELRRLWDERVREAKRGR
jgi:hypothetical protein